MLDIELPAGSILLRAGAQRHGVGVDRRLDAPKRSTSARSATTSRSAPSRRSRSARLAVDVPTGTDVNIKGASVDVSARGALGALRVRSASGDVSADDLVRADVTFASGDTRLDLVRNDADLQGNVGRRHRSRPSVAGWSPRWRPATSRSTTSAGDAEVETASGDVTIRRCTGRAVAVRTVSGDVRLGLPTGIRVEPEISTMSGKVSLPEPPTDGAPTDERRPVTVRLRSVSGDIRIERAG